MQLHVLISRVLEALGNWHTYTGVFVPARGAFAAAEELTMEGAPLFRAMAFGSVNVVLEEFLSLA
jgi:alkylhydroperoxidase family enzyme